MDASDWDARYTDRPMVWGEAPNGYVTEHATHLPRGRVLDLACGAGRNAVWLATRGWAVTGADYSAVALATAAQVGEKAPKAVAARLTWVQLDAVSDDLGGPYDLVLHVYLHLPATQRRAVLAKACAALASGGVLLLVAHDATNPTGGPQDPDVLYTPDDVVADLPADFTVSRAEQALREVDGAPEPAVDCVVVARRG